MPEKFHHTAEIAGSGQAGKLCKQATIGDLEATHLNPKVEGRIRLLNSKASPDHFSGLMSHFHLFSHSFIFIHLFFHLFS
jgi:hypothetical protein